MPFTEPDRRHAHRRHPRRGPPGARPPPARPADHHAREPLPHAHVVGPGDAARRRGGDHRRDPRPGADQAGRPPGALAGAARGDARAGRRSASGCRPRSARWRRSPASSAGGRRPASPGPVTIVDAGMRKPLEIEVVVPVEDMGDLGPGDRGAGAAARPRGRRRCARASGRASTPASSSWCRRTAPRSSSSTPAAWPSGWPPGSTSWPRREGVDAGRRPGELVKAHHGSLAREQRLVIEDELKRGELRGPRGHLAASSSASTWARSTSSSRSSRRAR